MNADIIHKIEELVESLNGKQKTIANRLKLEKNFRFFDSEVRGKSEIFFEDLSNKHIYHFSTYVKNICQCE
jgi:hypothetical protein